MCMAKGFVFQKLLYVRASRRKAHAAASQAHLENSSSLSFSQQVSGEGESSIKSYMDHWQNELIWLQDNPNESTSRYDQCAQKVDDDVAELQQLLAEEKERQRLKDLIRDMLTNGITVSRPKYFYFSR